MKEINSKTNNSLIFLILLLFQLTLTFLSKDLLNTLELIYNFYSDRLAQDQIEKIIESKQKWEWISFIIIPATVLIRSSLVAICLSVGMFFYNMNHTFKFKQFFKIALLGEFVIILVGYFKLGYFYFIKTDYTLLDIQQYYPLSYINFLDITKIEPWLIYPLQTINLFEIAYFFVLVYGLWKLTKNKYKQSLEIVAVSYGSGLVIWLGLVMFFTLNLS